MHWIRSVVAALAVAALALPVDAPAKKGHKKHGGKGGRHAWVHPQDRRVERDIARLVAARPRLPDGSRIVITAPRAPVSARMRITRPPSAAPAFATARTDQRRASAVDAFLRTHRPPVR
jgi:hypothetical protein